jgi:hypothetical protein
MHIDARMKLAAAQSELVRALVGNEIAPGGFDGSRIQATAEALCCLARGSLAGPRSSGGVR